MPGKNEITVAITDGIDTVVATFSGLSDEQLDTVVYDDGWTAREILAHLAGRQASYEMMSKLAQGGPPPDMRNFDVNAWNQQHVDARTGNSPDALIEEFRQVHLALLARVEAMDEETLNRTIMGPRGETTVGAQLMNSGGLHSTTHANDVKQALGV